MSTNSPVPNNPIPNRISDQLFQARLKANEFVQEHLKTLVTIASGTLVLTVSFVKDIAGPAKAAERFPGLLGLSWGTLGISVAVGVFALATLVNNLDDEDTELDTNKIPKAYSAGKQSVVLRYVQMAIFFFGLGMLSLAAFGALNYRLFLSRAAPSDNEKLAAAPFARFTMASTPQHTVAHGVIGSHTFLLDQETGQLWQMVCSKGQPVSFKKITAEDLPITEPSPKKQTPP
jgi:ascorbate-specific PTS system EIIC-type component UlaA